MTRQAAATERGDDHQRQVARADARRRVRPGLPDGATVDLRAAAGDPSSSIAEMGRVTGGAGKVILLVGDEDLEGQQAQLVVVGADGSLLLQRETTVGQNR